MEGVGGSAVQAAGEQAEAQGCAVGGAGDSEPCRHPLGGHTLPVDRMSGYLACGLQPLVPAGQPGPCLI